MYSLLDLMRMVSPSMMMDLLKKRPSRKVMEEEVPKAGAEGRSVIFYDFFLFDFNFSFVTGAEFDWLIQLNFLESLCTFVRPQSSFFNTVYHSMGADLLFQANKFSTILFPISISSSISSLDSTSTKSSSIVVGCSFG